MKKVVLPVCLVVLLAGVSFGQTPFPQPKVQPKAEETAPVIADYEDVIKYYTEWSKNVDNPDFYKTLSFEVQEKGKKKKTIPFKALPEIQKDVFYLKQAEECANQLLHLEQAWSRVLSQLKGMTEENKKTLAEKYKDIPALKRPPIDADVEKYLDKLLNIRKSHAVRYEQTIVSVFNKHKKVIPAADRRHYSKRVHAWHDRQKLIDRNKK